MKKLFILGEENDYGLELKAAYKKTLGTKFFIDTKSFSYELLKEKKIDVVITNGLTEEYYCLIKGLQIPSITFGSKELYSEFSDIIIDYKAIDDKRYFTGEQSKVSGNDDFQISGVVDLITKLDWDSDFFGFNVAFLSCMHLTENIMYKVNQFVRGEKIRLVEYMCNCHNADSVRLAEQYGFNFVDVRLVYNLQLDKVSKNRDVPKDISIEKALVEDSDHLSSIAKNSYIDSRYYFDHHFSIDKCEQFYKDWIIKSVEGKFDDVVYVAKINNEIAGYISLKKNNSTTGRIGLVGVANGFQGKGLGKILLNKGFEWFKEQDLSNIEVVTQGRNYVAQKLYQSVGFKTQTIQLWYHKWMH